MFVPSIWDYLRAVRVLGENSLEMFVDVARVDLREIPALFDIFPAVPWEVSAIVANEILASNLTQGSIDLTKGASLSVIGQALSRYRQSNYVPPEMSGFVDASEAAERWSALDLWNQTRGHFWPGNGPFFLESVNETGGTVRMQAFREYPWPANRWSGLAVSPIPRISVVSSPKAVLAGYPATVDFTVSAAEQHVSANASASAILQDTRSGNIVYEASAVEAGGGLYRVEIPAHTTDALFEGYFHLTLVATTPEASPPAIASVEFAIVSYHVWEDLIQFPIPDLTLILEEIGRIRTEMGRITEDFEKVNTSMAVVASLSITTIALSFISVVTHLRRTRKRR